MNVRKACMVAVLASVAGLYAGSALAADASPKTKTQESVYGWQLMTAKERTEYRNRMHAAKTYEERERIRQEHHEQMEKRAKERGVTLPDMPAGMGPGMGDGMGPGGGMGGGMGPGGGMGGGMGSGGGKGK